MPPVTVEFFEIDEFNEPKFWSHGLDREAVAQVLGNRRVVVRNRKGRTADYMLIGRDDSGRCITMPIAPTHDPYTWRPITAWRCKPGEAARLRQHR